MPYNLDILDPDNLGLEDLAKIAENFNILDDSRIVEHNLDVSDPSNGYYVRWKNGLQVCLKINFIITADNEVNVTDYWTFPASFLNPTRPFPVNNYESSGHFGRYIVSAREGASSSEISLRHYEDTARTDDIEVTVFAIGRWK